MIQFVLRRPYTVAAAMILITLLGTLAAFRMPVDIFPEINIPVVAVVWTYNGMRADEIQNRIVVLHERQMPAVVDNIERIEANSYNGVGVIKVYLHEGADVSRAVSQLASSALVVLKYMPPSITPPLVIRYGATDVPIIQLSMSSKSLTDTRLNDLGQNIIRPDLAVVQGASIPYPYGGKPRVIMVDLDPAALQARGLSPADISETLQRQNVILPSGDVKLGGKDYIVGMNNSPDAIATINQFPVKESGGKVILIRDVAYVHDGFQTQTNFVSSNGIAGGLMSVRKTGPISTLAVVKGVREALTDIGRLIPSSVDIKPIFDQSVFVRASLNGVLREGSIAAVLTGLMILLFLGNWRLTVIILISIPLSIVFALLAMYLLGETLNTMTLGGFALATGILVDDATVVIENMERHVGMGEELEPAIINGVNEILLPTLLSTLSICIVFIPVFLLSGTAKYLFSPLSLSVILSLLASLILSRTLVPTLFKYLMRSTVEAHRDRDAHLGRDAGGNSGGHPEPAHAGSTVKRSIWVRPFVSIHSGFDAGFETFHSIYREVVAWAVATPLITVPIFVLLAAVSCLLFTSLGEDFFPQVDAGQMRLHVRDAPGTRIEQTEADFAKVESAIRKTVGNNQIDVILDNIGLPYSGINIALSDSATVGPMDGEILISLKPEHTPTAAHMAAIRRELPRQFPQMQFFFQPADIVSQVLNFGRPAPIDCRISGPKSADNYALALKLAADLKTVPGIVDSHVFQVPDAPELIADVDRTMASEVGVSQRTAASSLLVTLNNSAQTAPNFWLNPSNSVSYPLVVQTPTYTINKLQDLRNIPLAAAPGEPGQLLMNIARFRRQAAPLVVSQLNIRPVFDVNANVQGRDLQSAAAAIEAVIRKDSPPESSGMKITLSGQVETMRESFSGLFSGMGLAVVLVFLLMVVNFQSWLDPIVVLMAVPFALAGVMWMLYLTQTPLSVPALMGTLMCIGLTTANSILVVSFARDRLSAGDDARTAAVAAGYTRLRPVLMTALAMILGMVPMALALGEGGEQNAPLARAVIGGLLFATFATLVFVPACFNLFHRNAVQSR